MRAFYFGCARGVGGHRDAGHHLYGPNYHSVSRPERLGQPWAHGHHDGLDGTLAPVDYYGELVFGIDDRKRADRGTEFPQGVAALHHRDGWTALAFWDRSGDSRGNSNSVFLFDTELTFEGALVAARKNYPDLFERFPFEVKPLPESRRRAA